MAKEWIVPDADLGCDGAYFGYKELVRCRECVYYKDAEFNVFTSHDKWCTYVMNSSYYREPDEYCSKGERREDGNNN